MKRIPILPVAAMLALAAARLGAQEAAPRAIHTLPNYLTPQPVNLPAGVSSITVSSADPTLPGRLQAALDKAYSQIDPRVRRGVQVSLIAPGLGQWNGSAGYSDSATPITAAHRFQIGSISKTFTAALIMKLAQQGKLSLDDSIGTWIAPHTNIDGSVRVRQLLNHSSGIFDYFNDDTTQSMLIEAYLVKPSRVWTTEEILAHVAAPNFKAGTRTRYSNTNYILLGMIVEKITGHSPAQEIRTQLLDPLGLANTFAAWEDSVTGDYAHGWTIGFDPNDANGQTDIYTVPNTAALSSAQTAGGMVSTAGDLARWANAFYNGGVLAKNWRDTMMAVKNTTEGEIGLGLFRWHYYQKLLYGHTGGILGYTSWAFSIPSDSVSMAVLINSFNPTVNIGSDNVAIALLTELYRTVSDVAEAAPAGGLMLDATYPDPAREGATVRYTLPAPAHVRLDLLDALGRPVATAIDGAMEAGSHAAAIDTRGLPAGTYFLALRAAGSTRVGTIRVVR